MASDQNQQPQDRRVLTPQKTPSWTFGLTITFLFVVVPLLLFLGFYYDLYNI